MSIQLGCLRLNLGLRQQYRKKGVPFLVAQHLFGLLVPLRFFCLQNLMMKALPGNLAFLDEDMTMTPPAAKRQGSQACVSYLETTSLKACILLVVEEVNAKPLNALHKSQPALPCREAFYNSLKFWWLGQKIPF